MKALLWKLGLSTVDDPHKANAVLEAFLKRPDNPLDQVTNQIAVEILARALRLEIAKMQPREGDVELKQAMLHWWNKADQQTRRQIEHRGRSVIDSYLSRGKPASSSKSPFPAAPKNTPPASKPPAAPLTVAKAPTIAPDVKKAPPFPLPSKVNAAPVGQGEPVPKPLDPLWEDPLSSTGLQWKCLPLPEHEPEFHDEYAQTRGETTDNLRILGARVRGKKHKHEGTHCDDWFEYRLSGPWTILCVSDGGGSYRFSRLGARVACQAAATYLESELASHQIVNRDLWEASSFAEPDIIKVNDLIVKAMQVAWKAIQDAVSQRQGNASFEQLLGRELTTKDLYCTLLITIHTTVKYQDSSRDLMFALSVGDGMIGVVDNSGKPILLMTPDSGEHSGEVRFVDEREVATDRLTSKIFPALCNLGSLMVMTDGVADDYFPNKPGMARLYGDLVLNGVLEIPSVGDNAIASEEVALDTLTREQLLSAVELPNPDGSSKTVSVLSMEKLAKALGLASEDLVRDVPRFARAVRRFRSSAQLPEEALRLWLEHYHVRGSFDDRTLLILTR